MLDTAPTRARPSSARASPNLEGAGRRRRRRPRDLRLARDHRLAHDHARLGGLAPPHDRWRDAEPLERRVDAALDSTISLFYLRRENAPIDGLPFTAKQIARTAAILDWLAGQLVAGGTSFGHGLGLAELSLVCALDWMDFSAAAYPTANHPTLAPLRAAWRERPSLAQTRPHT